MELLMAPEMFDSMAGRISLFLGGVLAALVYIWNQIMENSVRDRLY
jgi:hypothetical protein